MAEMILLPNADGTSAAQWIVAGVGISERWEALDDDNGDFSYVKCSAPTRTMIIEYANPSVPETDIASVDSVQFLSSGRSTDRTDPALVTIDYQAPLGNASFSCSYDAHRTNFETINGLTTIYSDGAGGDDAWTYSDLENLQMKCTKDGSVEVYLSYLALKVTYTAANNATFFGANF